MTVHYVAPHDIGLVWDDVRHIVQNACDKIEFGYKPEDIKQDLIQGKRQLWVLFDGEKKVAGITHISTRPRLKVGVMAIGGGDDLKLMSKFLPVLEVFFTNEGCQEIELIGRPGWARHMKQFGFETKYISTARKL